MELSNNVAFELHEQWRNTRIKDDGSYEPRWKKINDEKFVSNLKTTTILPTYIRVVDNVYEIDIANAYYSELSEDWKKENKLAAEVVANIIQSGKNLTREEIGYVIHDAWLERNTWAAGGELDVPFSQLPKHEQDKDMVQYDTALTMHKAKLEEKRLDTLDKVVEFLQEAKNNGENISYNFNGVTLYSQFDNIETCYLKVTGVAYKNKESAEIARKKLLSEIKEKRLKEEKEAIANIPAWKEKGLPLIYPQKTEEWFKCVEGRATDNVYNGLDLVNAIEIMESLEKDRSIEKASKIAIDANHSSISWAMVMKIVAVFSKQGPAFYRANNKEIDPRTEKLLKEIELKNEKFEEMLNESELVLKK